MSVRRARVAAAITVVLAGGALSAPALSATSATWDRLAQCESGKRWDINTGNGYYGGLQFSLGTWAAYGGKEFSGQPHKATRAQQITVAERLLHDQGWAPWPGCARKLGLTSADAAGNPFAPGTPPTTTPDAPAPPAASSPSPAVATAEKKVADKQAKATKAQTKAAKAQAAADRAAKRAGQAKEDAKRAKASKAPKREQAERAAKAAAAAKDANKKAKKARSAAKKAAKSARELDRAKQELAAAQAAAAPPTSA